MFQSILRPRELPRRHFLSGAGLALPVLAGLAAAALWASARPAPPVERAPMVSPCGPAHVCLIPAPPPPRPAPPDRGARPAGAKARPPSPDPAATPLVAPAVIPDERPREGGVSTVEPGLPPDGGGEERHGLGAATGTGIGPGVDLAAGAPLAFDPATMRDPVFLSGPQPAYTAKALEREVQGTAVARCVVTREGQVRDCRILRGLPFMDRAVLEALEQRRYHPATLAGRPVEVDYTFRLTLRLRD